VISHQCYFEVMAVTLQPVVWEWRWYPT